MADEYAMMLKNLLHESGFELKTMTRVVIGSGVPQLKTVFQELFERYLDIEPLKQATDSTAPFDAPYTV